MQKSYLASNLHQRFFGLFSGGEIRFSCPWRTSTLKSRSLFCNRHRIFPRGCPPVSSFPLRLGLHSVDQNTFSRPARTICSPCMPVSPNGEGLEVYSSRFCEITSGFPTNSPVMETLLRRTYSHFSEVLQDFRAISSCRGFSGPCLVDLKPNFFETVDLLIFLWPPGVRYARMNTQLRCWAAVIGSVDDAPLNLIAHRNQVVEDDGKNLAPGVAGELSRRGTFSKRPFLGGALPAKNSSDVHPKFPSRLRYRVHRIPFVPQNSLGEGKPPTSKSCSAMPLMPSMDV